MAGRAGHVQRGGARHLVGAAGHQRVEGQGGFSRCADRRSHGLQRRREPWAAGCAGSRDVEPDRRPLPRMVPASDGDAGAGRTPRTSRGARLSSSRTGLPASSLSTDFDAAGVLRADPVELEAVGHAQRHHGSAGVAVADVSGRQRTDPGVELLFGQFGGEAFTAALPEIDAHCGQVLFKRRDCTVAAVGQSAVIHSSRPDVNAGATGADCRASV